MGCSSTRQRRYLENCSTPEYDIPVQKYGYVVLYFDPNKICKGDEER